jgi:arylsulfatase A-like enzyme
VDLAPTILDLIGVKSDDFSFQGRSLAAALRGESPLDVDRPVYLYREIYENRQMRLFSGKQVWLKGEKFAILTGKWKYIEGIEENTRELFDLVADPQEQVNLNSTMPQKAAELASQLEAWKEVHRRKEFLKDKISKEDRERLKALGYVF